MREFGEHTLHATEQFCIVRCAGDQRLKSLIDEVYASGGRVTEIKPLRSGLEDAFVDVVGQRASHPSSQPAPRTPELELSRR